MNAAALVFDTETTGLTKHPDAPLYLQPKIIEFGCVLISLEDGRVLDEYNTLVDPGEPITAEITKITGIRSEDVRDAPAFRAVLPQIADRFRSARCMVAHNLPFDRAVLRGELARHAPDEFFPWPVGELCTVGLHMEEFGYQVKLTQLYEAKMGRPLAQTHRAVEDVRALVEIIQKEELWRFM